MVKLDKISEWHRFPLASFLMAAIFQNAAPRFFWASIRSSSYREFFLTDYGFLEVFTEFKYLALMKIYYVFKVVFS